MDISAPWTSGASDKDEIETRVSCLMSVAGEQEPSVTYRLLQRLWLRGRLTGKQIMDY